MGAERGAQCISSTTTGALGAQDRRAGMRLEPEQDLAIAAAAPREAGAVPGDEAAPGEKHPDGGLVQAVAAADFGERLPAQREPFAEDGEVTDFALGERRQLVPGLAPRLVFAPGGALVGATTPSRSEGRAGGDGIWRDGDHGRA